MPGWTTDQAAWEAAVRVALSEPSVVQEKIPLPYEPFPSVHDGRLHVFDRLIDTNPYVALGPFVHGCLTRVSSPYSKRPDLPLGNVLLGPARNEGTRRKPFHDGQCQIEVDSGVEEDVRERPPLVVPR